MPLMTIFVSTRNSVVDKIIPQWDVCTFMCKAVDDTRVTFSSLWEKSRCRGIRKMLFKIRHML